MQPTIHRLIVSDWAPAIEKTVRLIAVPIAAAYMAGLMVGIWIHQLNDAFAALTTGCQMPQAVPAAVPVIVQRCAVAPVVANVARPIGCSDQMAAAVAAVMGGMSQAAAARRYGVSRSTLRRRLAR